MENNYYFANINNKYYNLNIQKEKEFPIGEKNYISELGLELAQVKKQINLMNKSADKYLSSRRSKNKTISPKNIMNQLNRKYRNNINTIVNDNNLIISNDIDREMNNLSNTNKVPHHFGNYNSFKDYNLDDYNYVQNKNITMRSLNNSNRSRINSARFLSQRFINNKKINKNNNFHDIVLDHNIQQINSNKDYEINDNLNNINIFNRKISSSKNQNNMNSYNNYYNYNSNDTFDINENLLSQKRNITAKNKDIKCSPTD
jgi:hypothetical protein